MQASTKYGALECWGDSSGGGVRNGGNFFGNVDFDAKVLLFKDCQQVCQLLSRILLVPINVM